MHTLLCVSFKLQEDLNILEFCSVRKMVKVLLKIFGVSQRKRGTKSVDKLILIL